MVVNEERALVWLQNGAQPTETVARLFTKAGLMEKFTGKPAKVWAAAEEEKSAEGA